jgi:transcriptional regulator with XRE-family HTH domain
MKRQKLTLENNTNKYLRALKRKHGLTQEQVAALLSTSEYPWGEDVSVHRVSSWLRIERGNRMHPIFLEKLLSKLDEEVQKVVILEP